MTLVLWAGCDSFAIMMADRRSLAGRIEGVVGGALSLAEKRVTDGVAKIMVSGGCRDAFGVAGLKWALDIANGATAFAGYTADLAMFSAAQRDIDLAHAHVSDALPLLNTILHGDMRDGKMVCSRIEVSAKSLHWSVISSLSEKVQIAGAGSGLPSLQAAFGTPAVQDRWRKLEAHVADAQPLTEFVLTMFRIVHLLDDDIGPDVDVWRCGKDGLWAKEP